MEIELIISNTQTLPPAPQIMLKLLKLLRDENSGVDQIVRLIMVDASLTAQVIRLSNSAYFGFSTLSRSLEDSVQRIGQREIYKLVSLITSRQLLGQDVQLYNLAQGDLWKNSVTAAILCEEMARLTGEDQGEAYTMGLLHGIGQVVVNNYYMNRCLELAAMPKPPITVEQLRKEALEVNWAHAGAALLKLWKFPAKIYSPVHHQFYPMGNEAYRRITCMLYLACWSVEQINTNSRLDGWRYDGDSEVMKNAKMTEDKLMKCVRRACDALVQVYRMLGFASV